MSAAPVTEVINEAVVAEGMKSHQQHPSQWAPMNYKAGIQHGRADYNHVIW
jgi:hypothetical protein